MTLSTLDVTVPITFKPVDSTNLVLLDQQSSPIFPITNYQEFYKFYLREHHNLTCRRLHFAGSVFGLYMISKSIMTKKKRYLAYGTVAGYACAWVGHFVFEKNKPATFKQPLYSFISDWRMFSHILRGQISLTDQSKDKFVH